MEAKTRDERREAPKKDVEALLDGFFRALILEQQPAEEAAPDSTARAVQS